MDEETINKFLKHPGARRAANGVLLTMGDGTLFHLTGVFKKDPSLTNEETFFVSFCSTKEIKRLRELRNAHDYLLRLRANAIADAPRAIRVFSSRKKNYESGNREWSLAQYYHSMDTHHKKYIELLTRENRKILRSLPCGMALISEANAVCIRSLVGDVVVASESLKHFYFFMTLAFFGYQIGVERIDRVSALLIAVRIMNGSESLDFDLDPRGSLPIEIERTANKLVDLQMQFTFGHEFSHYLRKHIPSPFSNSSDELKEERNSDRDVLIFQHELEYEADLYAIKNITNKEAQAEVAQGGISVLMYLDFLEVFNHRFAASCPTTRSTHPPSIERVWRLHSSLGKTSGFTKEEVDVFIAVSQQLMDDLEQYIQHSNRPDVLTFYGSIYLPSWHSKMKLDRIDF